MVTLLYRTRLGGSDDDDWLFGNAGEDRLFGEAGDDRLFGGTGADKLDVSALGFSDFQDLLASTSDSGGTATISYGSGDSITLIGVATGDLVADDFTF